MSQAIIPTVMQHETQISEFGVVEDIELRKRQTIGFCSSIEGDPVELYRDDEEDELPELVARESEQPPDADGLSCRTTRTCRTCY